MAWFLQANCHETAREKDTSGSAWVNPFLAPRASFRAGPKGDPGRHRYLQARAMRARLHKRARDTMSWSFLPLRLRLCSMHSCFSLRTVAPSRTHAPPKEGSGHAGQSTLHRAPDCSRLFLSRSCFSSSCAASSTGQVSVPTPQDTAEHRQRRTRSRPSSRSCSAT